MHNTNSPLVLQASEIYTADSEIYFDDDFVDKVFGLDETLAPGLKIFFLLEIEQDEKISVVSVWIYR